MPQNPGYEYSPPTSTSLPLGNDPPTPHHPNPFTQPLGSSSALRPDHSAPSTHHPHNPFAVRNRTLTARSEDGTTKLPPLPPRKPAPPIPLQPSQSALVPPPRHSSTLLSPTARSQTYVGSHSAVPPPPPSKSALHVTSTLMKQSLQASKAAQTMKKAEEQLEKERVLQVLKSSSSTGIPGVYLHSPSNYGH